MELVEKVAAVRKVFLDLDEQIAKFQSATTLHCQWGCGKCCFKPDIEATILEFLPFALELYRQDAAIDWLKKLDESESEASICLILNPTREGAGLCSEYANRGLICRLFGYSARTDKYGDRELVTCQVIKTEQESGYQSAQQKIKGGLPVPVMNEFYMQLYAIDPDLATVNYPINTAIRKAIETVLQYYAYRS